MYRNKKTGFTLVELLAVIVILAIILVIAVPKVMSIIEDSKKATLESTAKMIASQAEKAKVQNTVLGKDKEINCKDVVKLNDIDYDKCIIEFDNDNNALVTIKGSGKFANLSVCEGDKTNANANNDVCNVSYGKASTYIEKLEAFTTNNGLIIDDTPDKNIRYAGSNPNNKVYFNCKDKDSSNNVYGEENYDYAHSCEVWRIIGVFEVDNGEGKLEKRVKLVRDALPVAMSLDSSANNINAGYGINQWGESTDEDGLEYLGADIKQMLNGYYIGEEPICKYCNSSNQGTCENDCASNITPLSSASLSMIEKVLWTTGGKQWTEPTSVLSIYNAERGNEDVKKCSSTSTYNGLYLCTDTVERTTTWEGLVGLIYPSDYGYASTDSNCINDIYDSDSACKNNNWLLFEGISYWTITPNADILGASSSWYVNSDRNVVTSDVRSAKSILPSIYLASNVYIIGGNGATEPYKLAI